MVIVAPELCGYEDVFAGDAAFLDAETDLFLGIVDSGCVNVAVPQFEGCGNRIFLLVGVLEGA